MVNEVSPSIREFAQDKQRGIYAIPNQENYLVVIKQNKTAEVLTPEQINSTITTKDFKGTQQDITTVIRDSINENIDLPEEIENTWFLTHLKDGRFGLLPEQRLNEWLSRNLTKEMIVSSEPQKTGWNIQYKTGNSNESKYLRIPISAFEDSKIYGADITQRYLNRKGSNILENIANSVSEIFTGSQRSLRMSFQNIPQIKTDLPGYLKGHKKRVFTYLALSAALTIGATTLNLKYDPGSSVQEAKQLDLSPAEKINSKYVGLAKTIIQLEEEGTMDKTTKEKTIKSIIALPTTNLTSEQQKISQGFKLWEEDSEKGTERLKELLKQ